MKKNKFNKINLFYILILFLMVSIIKDPALSINSAKSGLNIWFNVLLPSLLPFFILSELLILSGFVKTFGNFLKPIMKPFFNVSGEGSFPLIMSMVSGYPVGSKLTCSLRRKKIITKDEADRLICFTSTSGPLFMIGAVLVGMLNSPSLKLLIILPHYLGAITIGILLRFYKPRGIKGPKLNSDIYIETTTYHKSPKPLGYLISESVKDGMNSIIAIGGFVIIYSVIIDVLLNSNLINVSILNMSRYLNLDIELLKSLFAGIFEISIGSQKLASLNINIFYKICLINFIIAWGGFSTQSQALSFISQTDISSKIFIVSKFFHGLFSALYTYVLYLFAYRDISIPSTSFPQIIPTGYDLNNWLATISSSIKLSIGISIYFFILSIFVCLICGNKKEA